LLGKKELQSGSSHTQRCEIGKEFPGWHVYTMHDKNWGMKFDDDKNWYVVEEGKDC